MRARTHVWLAQTALAVLDTDPRTAPLAEHLRRHPKELWLGSSWLPDVSFGDVNTAHICHDDEVAPTGRLPRRISELSDAASAHVGRRDTPYGEAQTALAFCTLGHYLADANCPLHVDPRVRDGGSLPASLHHELEEEWESWFRDDPAGMPKPVDDDSPLSIVARTAAARWDEEAAAQLDPAGRACSTIRRTRAVSLAGIPEHCADLAELQSALGPRGLEMMAAECFAWATADMAAFWRAAWIRATSGSIASIEI